MRSDPRPHPGRVSCCPCPWAHRGWPKKLALARALYASGQTDVATIPDICPPFPAHRLRGAALEHEELAGGVHLGRRRHAEHSTEIIEM